MAMTALHWVLVAMVSVWTVVSLVLGALVVLLIQKLRAQLTRVDAILQTTQDVAQDVRAPIHAVAESVREVFGTPPDRRRPVAPTLEEIRRESVATPHEDIHRGDIHGGDPLPA